MTTAHLVEYLEAGGWVMPLLIVILCLLWFTIGYRMMLLQRGTAVDVEQLCRRILKGEAPEGYGVLPCTCKKAVEIVARKPIRLSALDHLFYGMRSQLARFENVAKAMIIVAPLLGLLGTVSGMIETFDSLAHMALFRQSGGIAGGISKALFTTQMGLAVAIPGYFLLAVLHRRRKNLESDLLKLQDLLHESLHKETHA